MIPIEVTPSAVGLQSAKRCVDNGMRCERYGIGSRLCGDALL